MITVSLCMIVRDEEAVLGRCLDCIADIVDQIVIVDTGSTDRTVEIAAHYTTHIHHFQWIDDFAAARNFSFSKADCDYILWLDADDVIDRENAAALQALKQDFPAGVDVGVFPYATAFDPDGTSTFRYCRERLLRRSCGYRWTDPVHEYIDIGDGRTCDFAITVQHRPLDDAPSSRNLEIYEQRRAQGLDFSPRATYYYARELYQHQRFEKAAVWYTNFLGLSGIWLEDAIWASLDLADCLTELGEVDRALDVLFSSFRWDLPRAETACRIATLYMDQYDDAKAVFWYELALTLPQPEGWGFIAQDFWGFLPHMQLCVLYYRMGQMEQAALHHHAAGKIKPQDEMFLYNQRFFSGDK